jgi:glycosyltransferase involved in cell wall biosynthesis
MIPTYGQSKYIRRAVQSALEQDYENLEVIIADDCSFDNTSDVVLEFLDDSRVKYIRNIRNVGRVKNYRNTLKNANGEWVINLDGDDFYIDNCFISKAVELIEKYPQIDMVFANRCKVATVKNKEIFDYSGVKNYKTIIDGNDVLFGYPNKEYYFHHLTTLYRREKALDLDFYRYDIISSDLESLLRYIPNIQIGFLKDVVAAWRYHESNESKSIDIQARIENLNLATGVFDYLSSKNLCSYRDLVLWREKMLGKMSYDFISNCLAEKNYRASLGYYHQATTIYPEIRKYIIFNWKLAARLVFPKLIGFYESKWK